MDPPKSLFISVRVKAMYLQLSNAPHHAGPSAAFWPYFPFVSWFLIHAQSLTLFFFFQLPEILGLFPTSWSLYVLFPLHETLERAPFFTSLLKCPLPHWWHLPSEPHVKQQPLVLQHSYPPLQHFLALHCVGHNLMLCIYLLKVCFVSKNAGFTKVGTSWVCWIHCCILCTRERI